LRQAPDADLQLYLLQLVQALKYERDTEDPRGLATLLIEKSCGNAGIASHLYW